MITAHSSQYSPTLLRSRNNWRFARGEDFQHGVYRLVMMESGLHEVITRSESMTCREGDFYLIQPGEYQSIKASPGSRAGLLVFTVIHTDLNYNPKSRSFTPPKDHLQPSPEEIWGVQLPLVIDHELSNSIQGLFRITLSLLWKTPWEHYLANMRLANILERIVSYYHQADSLNYKKHSADDLWLQQIDDAVTDGIQHLRTTEELAGLMNLSSGYFSRKFKSLKGISPAQYLRARRLEEARRLLIHSDWSIQLIAEHLNYPSISTFTQTWQRNYNLSPSDYRKNMML